VLARWFMRRLGGFTGDTLGAAQQLTEIAFYLAVLASWNSF
jgi:adenosylcobinamide-GDP ribazoletransferase